MSMTEPTQQQYDSSSRPKRVRAPIWQLIVAGVVPAAAVVAVLWFIWYQKPLQEGKEFASRVMLQTSGLTRPTVNKLDSRFTDADGDFVADAPADAKDQVDPPTLVFSYVAITQDPDNPTTDPYKAAFAEFVQHVSKVTGKPVEYHSFTSLNDQLKAMREGQLHISGFNTGGVPMAVDLCGFVPVSKLATADGIASYRMQVIVPADSSIRSLDDVKGHELTLTEPGSNSGYKAPMVLLRDQCGLLPERDYLLRYSGAHDSSIIGIASKKYQAAAVAGDVLRRAVSKGEITANQYRVVYESEFFPTACFGYVYNLKPELAGKIRRAIFDFDWKGTGMEKEFANADQSKFVPAAFKDDWALVRKIDDATGIEYKID
ncbi:MAG TPA: phosphate/phosphite/phosphonate ABC transporter substrate-binding protein [Tepidisphaeraceae bacterium]|jgi:phosphonate transport system substrate-binding protein